MKTTNIENFLKTKIINLRMNEAESSVIDYFSGLLNRHKNNLEERVVATEEVYNNFLANIKERLVQ